MYAKCEKNIDEELFILPEELFNIVTDMISNHIAKYKEVPTHQEALQMILSAKQEIYKSQTVKDQDAFIEGLHNKKAILTKELDLVNSAIADASDITKKHQCCENKCKTQELSFDQCVETAAGKIKEVIASLKMEYSDVILSHAIDVINDSKSEDAIVGIDKEFDSELFKILEIMSKARKALKTESIINHDENGDRRKQLNVIIDEMTVWVDKLYVAFDNKK